MKKKLLLVVFIPLLIIANSYGQTYKELKEHDSLDAKGNVVGHISYGIAVLVEPKEPPINSPKIQYFDKRNKFIKFDEYTFDFHNTILCGIKDSIGKIVLPGAFTNIEARGNFFIATLGTSNFLYDSNFVNIPLPMEYDLMDKTNTEDFFIVRSHTSNSNDGFKMGVIDLKGNIILPIIYNGISSVKLNKYEEQQYDSVVIKNGDNNNIHLADKFLIVENKLNKYAIYNIDKKLFVTGFDYDYCSIKAFGIILKSVSKQELLDFNFKPLIDEKFDLILDFNKSPNVVVKRNGKFGLLGMNGKYLLPLEYDLIERIPAANRKGGFIAKKNGLYKLVDNMGRPMMNSSSFSLLTLDVNEKVLAKKNEKMGLIDDSGKVLIPLIYDTILKAVKYMYYVACEGNNCGILNDKNEVLLPVKYQLGNVIYDQFLIIRQGNKYGVFSYWNNKIIHECDCDLIAPDNKPVKNILCIKNNELITIKLSLN